MKRTVAAFGFVLIAAVGGAEVVLAAKDIIVSNRIFQVTDKKTKVKGTFSVVANPQNAVKKPVTLCAIWEDTMSKENKGTVKFEATLETEDEIISGTITESRREGLAWACFTAADTSISVNDLAYVDVTPKKLPKETPSDIVLIEFNVGPQRQVEITSAARLGLSVADFRSRLERRVVPLEAVERDRPVR